jgi:O-methyltransferase domain/Dimerisation domain
LDPVSVERTSPEHILDVAYAFWKAKALLSAVELDLFTILADRPLDADDLTSRLDLHSRGARDFFDALVALGLLTRDESGKYANRPDADLYLDRRKPTCIGELLKHLGARHYHNWGLLTRALKTGAPQSGALAEGYPSLYSDPTAQEVFLAGMTAGSLLAARSLAVRFPWKRYRTFVDVGTAQGCVPVEIARAHPHLRGGGFDLPIVKTAFTQYVTKHGFADCLQFYAGDFFADPLPAADVMILGRILHNWDLATRKLLLNKAYAALPDGGALLVYDPLIDEARTEPHGLLSSLNMLIETQGGAEYTSADCMEWMREVGFRECRAEPLGDVHTAVIGVKSHR